MSKKLKQNGISISLNDPTASSVDFDDTNLWVSLTDGRQLGVPLVYFPRLLCAKKKDLKNYELSGGGRGIHWDNLDEDISVKGLLLGFTDQTQFGRALL